MPGTIRKISLLFCLTLLASAFYPINCLAQRFLTITKDGRLTKTRFTNGDKIKVWLADGPVNGEITYVGESTVTINDKEIAIDEIEALRYDSKKSGMGLLRQAAVKLPIAGTALILMDMVNASANPSYSQWSTGIVIVAGSLIIIGPIAYLLTYRKHKIGGRKQLRMLDLTMR